jgi:hypothetical protein
MMNKILSIEIDNRRVSLCKKELRVGNSLRYSEKFRICIHNKPDCYIVL